jgi:hypothetical protein
MFRPLPLRISLSERAATTDVAAPSFHALDKERAVSVRRSPAAHMGFDRTPGAATPTEPGLTTLLTPIELAPDPIARRSIWISYAPPAKDRARRRTLDLRHDQAGFRWNQKHPGWFARGRSLFGRFVWLQSLPLGCFDFCLLMLQRARAWV